MATLAFNELRKRSGKKQFVSLLEYEVIQRLRNAKLLGITYCNPLYAYVRMCINKLHYVNIQTFCMT